VILKPLIAFIILVIYNIRVTSYNCPIHKTLNMKPKIHMPDPALKNNQNKEEEGFSPL